MESEIKTPEATQPVSVQPTSSVEHGATKKSLFVWLFLVALVIAVIGVAWWFGYQQVIDKKHVSEVPKTSGKVMTVGDTYWPGQYWVEIADKKGWFKQEGLQVKLVDTNPDFYASLKDVADGKLDTQDFYLFDLVSANLNGANLVMVINDDQSSGAEALVSKNTIKTPQDLVGKRIGVSKGTNLEFLLDTYLEKNKIDHDAIIEVEVLPEQALKFFQKGDVDAVVTYEPYVSEVVEKQKGLVLFDTSDIPGISVAGYVFRKDFIQNRPEDIQAFVNVWNKTIEFIKQNPKESFAIVAKKNNKTVGEVQAFTAQDKILDLQDNLTAFSYSSGFESLHGTARRINDFLIDQNITKKKLDTTELLDARFIRALEK